MTNKDLLEHYISKSGYKKSFIAKQIGVTSYGFLLKLNNKNDFLKYIDGNINALDSLSVDRLKKLKEYYAQVIEENDIIINQLKKSN